MAATVACSAGRRKPPQDFVERLTTIVGALRALTRRIDAWREARRRAAEDRAALANMSDRELHDIGISRTSIEAVVQRSWAREYPH